MACKFYTTAQVLEFFGNIGRTTLTRWSKEGCTNSQGEKVMFPKPALQGTPHRWRIEDIEEFASKL